MSMSTKLSFPNAVFDFNINIDSMLQRPRINQIFSNGLGFPITIVYAPAGYGKTTAALQFAKNSKAHIIYLSLCELDRNPQHFWKHLCGLYEQICTTAGVKLGQLGFPSSNGLFLQFVEISKELLSQTRQILIIDDFHLADCPQLGDFLFKISSLRLKELNIVILSRVMPKFCSVDMKVKGLISEVTKEHLCFNLQELSQYFKSCNIHLGKSDAKKIDRYTEGWACAVYLTSLYYRQNPDAAFDIVSFDVDRLIENTIFVGYDEETRNFLLSLSILDRFDVEICNYITGKSNAYELLSQVLYGNSLIKISEDKQYFEMHRLFRDFLQKKLVSQGTIDKKSLHVKAAEYWEYKNDILMSLVHLDQAGDYEKMVQVILNNKCAASFSTQELMMVSHYLGKIPREYYLKYPMLLLISAMLLTRTEHAAKSFELIAEVEMIYQNHEMSGEMKKKLRGEAAVIKALMAFNNPSRMLPFFKEASRLLTQGTELLSEKISFTFGSPSILYLYYHCPGKLDNTIDVFTKGFKYWERISGCGYGGDYLLKAEAAFERCEYETAEQEAYRAIYRAEQKNQYAIIIAAKLLIIKISAAKSSYSRAALVLKEMREMMNYRKALIYLSTIDMCEGIFCLLTGDVDGIPKWLQEGELTVSAVNRAGFGIEFLIYTEVLSKNEQYLRIEGIISTMFEVYGMFSNQYGVIRTHLLTALVYSKLYGIERAVPSLNEAFRISDPDRVIMPYLEYGEYLLPVFREVSKNYHRYDFDCSRNWLEDIIRRIKEYQDSLIKFRMGFNAAHPEKADSKQIRLTKREKEILELIIKGLSSDEISKKLFVAPITVRVITSKIYKKLGVKSRVEAVKIAIDNGLVN